MADSKITALTSIGASTDPVLDQMVIVDVSDGSMAATGTTKKVTLNQLLGASGTATLASATITGNLTVDTNTFAVDASTNRVFVGTAPISTAYPFYVTRGGTAGSIAQFTDGTAQTLTIDSAAGGLLVGNANNGYLEFAANSLAQYRIAPLGVFSWYDGAGGTRMTLNSTGLGVGYAPSGSADKIGSAATLGVVATGATADLNFRNSSLTAIQRIRYTDGTGVLAIGSATGTAYPVELGGNTTTRAVTIDASGNLGVGVTPSGTGGCLQLKSGITFPATQVASSDANTLDDYEEGTFTPTIQGATTSGVGTYTAQNGRYTKVGNLVTFQVFIDWTAHTGAGNMRIGNLPFTNGGSFWAGSVGYSNGIALSAGFVMTGYVESGQSWVTLQQYPTGGGGTTGIPMDTAGAIIFSASYTV
jgi:hypothetical protein